MTDWISKIITTPAVTQNLTTLATVKTELNILATDTGDDAWLAQEITQVSAIVSNYCNRRFMPEQLVETQQIQQDPYPYQTPGGVQPLQLSRWPLIKVNSVKQIYPIAVSNDLTVDVNFSIDFDKGQLQRLNAWTGVAVIWESLPTKIDYYAGYGAESIETWTIPATPYQVTPRFGTTLAFIVSVTYAIGGAALTQVNGAPSHGQYAVDTSTGLFTFAAADTTLQVVIDYVYSQIPADVQHAVLRSITQSFNQRDRDPLLMSIDQPGVGSKRYWIPGGGKDAMQNGGLPPEVAGVLAPYRSPVIA
jgi:hypothetical protein